MPTLSLTQTLTLFVCGIAAGYAIVQIGRAILASRWPSVEGEIATTRLVHRFGVDGPEDYDYIGYRYSVNGRPYRGDRVRFGPQVAPRSIIPTVDPEPDHPNRAATVTREYPQGARVRVYYNPRRPEESVLYLTPAVSVWGILAAAGVFAYATLFGHG